MKKNKIWLIIWLSILYIILKHWVPYGNIIVYPITLMVTFLHEFWHSFFAIITWWSVKDLQINANGSWHAVTVGGIRSLVIMWWYIWSALFGCILLYIWAKKSKASEIVLYILAWLMIVSWIILYSSIISSIILFLLAAIIIFLAYKTDYDEIILMTLWTTSLVYIIEDFNVWPSSDLEKFSWILPSGLWMIIWLLIVLTIILFTLKMILKDK